MSSMPRFEAASISIRSSARPSRAARHSGHVIARVAVYGVLAVDGAVQDARDAGLAGAARTGEQVGVRRAAEPDRVAQRAGDVLLADHVLEALRAPAQVQRAVRLAGAGGRWAAEVVKHGGCGVYRPSFLDPGD